MRREAAEKIVRAVGRIERIFGESDDATDQIDDDEEKRRMRWALASLVLDIHEKITLEIVKKFPDLHPDKARCEF